MSNPGKAGQGKVPRFGYPGLGTLTMSNPGKPRQFYRTPPLSASFGLKTKNRTQGYIYTDFYDFKMLSFMVFYSLSYGIYKEYHCIHNNESNKKQNPLTFIIYLLKLNTGA